MFVIREVILEKWQSAWRRPREPLAQTVIREELSNLPGQGPSPLIQTVPEVYGCQGLRGTRIWLVYQPLRLEKQSRQEEFQRWRLEGPSESGESCNCRDAGYSFWRRSFSRGQLRRSCQSSWSRFLPAAPRFLSSFLLSLRPSRPK
jgi:hypothetical protein